MNVKIVLLCLVFLLVCWHGSLVPERSSGLVWGKDVYPGLSVTAEPTSGTAPLTVDFTAEVTDPYGGQFPVTYDWYFDDGAASTKRNPRHTFSAAGTYTVTCRATFWKSPKISVQGGVDIQVTGIPPLNLSVSADATSGKTPLTVNFTSTVTGGVGTITYHWDFGDISTSTQANPSHTFTDGGTFTVTCTVTDSASPPRTAQATVDIDVIESYWPVAVCTAVSTQYSVQIAADGSGGALMAWHDYRSGSYSDIYAQRVDASGSPLWSANGVAVCTAENIQHHPQLIADGSGGAVIAWQDLRSGTYNDIYAQRVDKDGNVLWTANGAAICTAANHQYTPQITPDGSGGAIIVWHDARPGSHTDIYAQRVDKDGNVLWTANGTAACLAINHQTDPQVTADGAGGALITWQDHRVGDNYDVYAQRVDKDGNVLWTANGAAVCTAANDQHHPQLIADGAGGGIITWQDYRSGSCDIYAQRVDKDGNVLWTANGAAVCTAANDQYHPQPIADGAGGGIITWYDNRSDNYDIYAQRLDSAGNLKWTGNGVAICTAASHQYYPQLIADGSAGAVVTWYDNRSGNYDIYAQRVDQSGTPLWTADGAAVCTADNYQQLPQITAGPSGSAIITWNDSRSGNYDIYAQRVNQDGTLE